MNILKKVIVDIWDRIRQHSRNKLISFTVVNSAIVLVEYIYIGLRFKFINEQIPFWYTRFWGDMQLAPKIYIYAIPLISVTFILGAIILYLLLDKFFVRYLMEMLSTFVTLCNIFLFGSAVRLIQVASVPFEPLVSPDLLYLAFPLIIAFLLVHIAMPYFIEFAHSKNLVTLPHLHAHPGMVLQQPSARSGGLVYAVVVLTLTIIFLGFSKTLYGLFLSLVLVAVLGLVDDIQNTDVTSSFKLLENPFLRLFLLFSAVSPVILSGLRITFVGKPLGGIYDLASFSITLGGFHVPLLSALLTVVWMVWVMNVLSWSNGIDGQYCGIVGIASLIIAILALRFDQVELVHKQAAIIAAISAGAAFGFTRHTWHPSKIMWGFGAVSAGLVISVLSIMINAKIVTSVLIILIPFLDALVTVTRRILQGKNPLRGDRGHLHHLLMERGWGVKKIAIFYWVATALFGVIGLLSADLFTLQLALFLMGVVGFFIVLLNVSSIRRKKGSIDTA